MIRAMNLYLGGPMTGCPASNFPAFHNMAARLREWGHVVTNPADNFGGACDLALWIYFRRDLADVIKSESMALLPGWEGSSGTLKELLVAIVTGRTIYLAEELSVGFVAPLSITEATVVGLLHGMLTEGDSMTNPTPTAWMLVVSAVTLTVLGTVGLVSIAVRTVRRWILGRDLDRARRRRERQRNEATKGRE